MEERCVKGCGRLAGRERGVVSVAEAVGIVLKDLSPRMWLPSALENKGRTMFHQYRFESDVYDSLERIPMQVRMKLDIVGVKISLETWLAAALEERRVLCHLPVDTGEEREVFHAYLDSLWRRYSGKEVALAPPTTDAPWEGRDCIPEPVRVRSRDMGQAVTTQEWGRWSSFQRYALFKLSISKNEPEQFYAALREFRG